MIDTTLVSQESETDGATLKRQRSSSEGIRAGGRRGQRKAVFDNFAGLGNKLNTVRTLVDAWGATIEADRAQDKIAQTNTLVSSTVGSLVSDDEAVRIAQASSQELEKQEKELFCKKKEACVY